MGEGSMKIQYLALGAECCPLVRLFDFVPEEVNRLRQFSIELSGGGGATEIALHEESWIEPVDRCRFYWRRGLKDVGVLQPARDEPLVLSYSAPGWLEVEEKLHEFVDCRPGCFNWLTMEGDVRVLISMDGSW
jgi:hypothetical protein